MNFDMASEMAEMEGITVKTTLGRDDVTSAPNAEMERRRGVGGARSIGPVGRELMV